MGGRKLNDASSKSTMNTRMVSCHSAEKEVVVPLPDAKAATQTGAVRCVRMTARLIDTKHDTVDRHD